MNFKNKNDQNTDFFERFISDEQKSHAFRQVFLISGIKKESISGSLIIFLLELAGGIEPPTY